MSVNQRQFDQLTEMGISLWQSKDNNFTDNSSNQLAITKGDDFIAQDNLSLLELTKQTIFTDILQAIGVSIGEITAQKDHFDLGLFNWYFSAKKHDTHTIQCEHNLLITPHISLISQSPKLKKQLWLNISKHLL
tara:strand:+ start:94 stop:495 length:402 start_codon:yes stop_codon:yes gene_type:complete